MSGGSEREGVFLRAVRADVDWKRIFFALLGIFVFLAVYFSPPLPDAVDPSGQKFPLTREGRGALALFLLAGIWWIAEVVPVGITSIAIGVLQVLFLIRPAREAFRDFTDPAVMFIFGSMVVGAAFTKTGLTKRIAYGMLWFVGERTSMILLGALVITALLTHLMAHTAVAATLFPVFLAIYALYGEGDKRTNFGKALFIGMAYSAGAGSIITFLGAARTPAAASLFKEFSKEDIGFFELTIFMFPVGWLMVLLIWFYFLLFLKPEKERVPGLKDKALMLSKELGPMSFQEKFVLSVLLGVILLMALQSFMPQMKPIDRSAIMLTGVVLFFLFRILTLKELEDIPWNIILLFSGAMSLGFCLWKTGAAHWIAVHWLKVFEESAALVFLLGVALLVLTLTNFIMNVAAIAITLPVSLVIASYLNVEPRLVLFASLVTSGMPFLLLIGAAPNAIAYNSNQFTAFEFFKHGIVMSLVLMLVLILAITVYWPLLLD